MRPFLPPQGYDAAKRMFSIAAVHSLCAACPALRTAAYTVIAPPPPPLLAALAPRGVDARVTLYVRLRSPMWEIDRMGGERPALGTYCPGAMKAYDEFGDDTDAAVCATCAALALPGAASVTQLVFYAYDSSDEEAWANVPGFGDESLLALARMLRAPHCAIETLVLNRCLRDDGVESDSVAELAAAVRACAPLRELHVAEAEGYLYGPDLDGLLAACAEHAPPVRVVREYPRWADTGRPEPDWGYW